MALSRNRPDVGSALTDTVDGETGRLTAYALSGLFILLGISAFVWLIVAVLTNPGMRTALGWIPTDNGETPSLIIAFLTEFGIVVPTLVLVLGGLSIWLGFRLRVRDIAAARWAQVVLAWLAIAVAAFVGFSLISLAAQGFSQRSLNAGSTQIAVLLTALSIGVVFGLALVWLNRNVDRVFRGREHLGSQETRLAWTLLTLTLAVFLLVAARPLEQTFIRSLTDKRFAGTQVPNYVGMQNYRQLLTVGVDVVPCRVEEASGACVTRDDGSIRWQSIDRERLEAGFRAVWNIPWPLGSTPRALVISSLDADFLRSVRTTLLFTVASVSLELLIALFLALTVNSDFAGRGMMRAVTLIPWAIPTVVTARLWELMLKDTSAGIVNRALMSLQVIDAPRAWLVDVSLQVPAAIMVDAWKTAPFMALLLLAGLQSIQQDLYEAAEVDGANRVEQFWYITLPLLRPTIAVALVFRTLDALRVFDLFNVLFGRQPLSMATYNYETLVNNQQDGYASAISIILFLVISVFAVIYVRILNVETG